MTKQRRKLAKIAQETLTIIIQGKYKDMNGEVHDIQDAIEWATDSSQLLGPETLVDLRGMLGDQPMPYDTQFQVVNESSFSAAYRLSERHGEDAEIMILNFASGTHPGGGFIRGAQAQEECLARGSALYPTLTVHKEMYDFNRTESRLYSDHMIFSPEVPTFRNDYDQLIAPRNFNYLTTPAVNKGSLDESLLDQADPVMQERMRKMLTLAVHKGQDQLVLGAWGCGVFGNNGADVAQWFHEFLTGEFDGAFHDVIFAILDTSDDKQFIGPFQEVFDA